MNGIKLNFNSYLAKVQKGLKTADKKTRGKASEHMIKMLKEETPKITGDLRSSIKKKDFNRSTIVGPTWPKGAHAHLVEFGHDTVAKDGTNDAKKRTEANPFFKRTWERERPTLQKMIKDGFAEI